MSDRSVSVKLRAEVNAYVAGMRSAAEATVGLERATKSAQESARAMTATMNQELARQRSVYSQSNSAQNKYFADLEAQQKRQHESMSKIGTASVVMGGAIAVGIGAAVKSFMEFDKEMSAVGAAASAHGRDLDALRSAALQAGKDTKFSATEAAQGEEELAKAGVGVTDIINGGLRGALNLAAAGNQTVGQAAETAATSMTRFGLSGAQVPHVADVLAAAANKAQGDVSDMASALDYAGVQAAQMGASFESVVGTLALFAHNGLVGSQAGTELRGMIASLSGPSKAAKNEMEGLGISIYDVHGKFIGLDGVANELHTKLSGLSQAERDQALNIIFSNQQMAAAEILMKSGAKGVQDWTNNVNQSGYAANLAGQKMNNLAGDVEQLKGSIETALIQSGSSGNTVLRGMAKGANDVVGAYLDMPGPVQKGATAVAAVGSAAAITGGAMLLMIPKIEAAKVAMADLGGAAATTEGVLMGVGTAATIVGGSFVAAAVGGQEFRKWVGDIPKGGQEAARTLQQIGASGNVTKQQMADLGAQSYTFKDALHATFNRSTANEIAGFFTKVGSFGGVAPWGDDDTAAAKRFFKSVDAGLTTLVASGKVKEAEAGFKAIADQARQQGVSVEQLRKRLPQYSAAIDGVSEATKKQGQAAKTAAGYVHDEVDAYKELKGQLDELTGANQGVLSTNIRYRESVIDLTKKLKESHGSLSLNTAAGRDSASAFLDSAKAAQDYAEAVAKQTNSVDKGNNAAAELSRQLIKTAVAMGVPKAEAEKLAAAVVNVPKKGGTTWTMPGLDEAMGEVIKHHHGIDQVPKKADTVIGIPGMTTARTSVGGFHKELDELPKREGPAISAPGTTTATGQVKDLHDAVGKLHGATVPIDVKITGQVFAAFDKAATGGAAQSLGVLRAHNAGGTIDGFGDTDTVPAMLTPGEDVIRKPAAERNRALLKYINAVGHKVDVAGDAAGIGIGIHGRVPLATGGTVPVWGAPDLGTDNWLAPYYAGAVHDAHLAHLAHEHHMKVLAAEHARQVASANHELHVRHVAHEHHLGHERHTGHARHATHARHHGGGSALGHSERELLAYMARGGRPMEDLAFRGMPRGYNNTAVADAFYGSHRGIQYPSAHFFSTLRSWLSAQTGGSRSGASSSLGRSAHQLLAFMNRGGHPMEDFAFTGMPSGYRFSALADRFYGSHPGFNFGPRGNDATIRHWLAANFNRGGTVPVQRFAGGGTIAAVQQWIREQDPKPYIWGGAGPGGFDCSGLTGAVYGKLTGRGGGSGQRYFTTADEQNYFAPGTGAYTIGLRHGNPGHTAGNLGGLAFEARSTATGIFTGPSAKPVTSFPIVMHLRQLGGQFIDSGGEAGFPLSLSGMRSIEAAVGARIIGGIARSLGFPVRTFDTGGTLDPGLNLINNGTGLPEHLVPVPAAAAGGSGSGGAAGMSEATFARIVRAAMTGMGVRMDNQTVGRIEGRRADMYTRAG
jgi:TP901 family phage tail tape measure protein